MGSSSDGSANGTGEFNTIGTGLAYTSPRLIANSIQYIFNTYLGELYINTCKWKPDDFGLVTSIFSFTLGVSHISLGAAVNEFTQSRHGASGSNSGQLKTTKNIEIVSIGIHILTFFFLILLPFYWSGIRIKTVDVLAEAIIKCWTFVFRTRAATTSRSRFNPRSQSISRTPPVTIDPEPPPQCILCFNTPKCNAILQFVKSRLFIIYMITIIHGVAFTTFDLCNRSIPTDVSKKDKTTNTLNAINFGGYGIVMLLINAIISLIKFFLGQKVSDVELFFSLTIILILLQFPVFAVFDLFTQSENDGGGQNNATSCTCTCPDSSSSNTPSPYDYIRLISVTIFHAAISFWLSTPGPLVQYLSTNMFDGNEQLKNFGPLVLLLCFTATMIGYILFKQLSDKSESEKDECCCKVGGSSCCTGGEKCKCCCCKQESGTCRPAEGCTCQCTAGSSTECCCKKCCRPSKDSGTSLEDYIMTGVAIVGQFAIYLVFFPYNYRWNVGSWSHILIFGISGSVYGVFLINIGSLLDIVIKKKAFERYKVIVIGGFFSLTHLCVSLSVYKLYKYYDKETISSCPCSCIQVSIRYNFISVYKIICLIFQVLDIVAAVGYYLEDLKGLFGNESASQQQPQAQSSRQVSVDSEDKSSSTSASSIVTAQIQETCVYTTTKSASISTEDKKIAEVQITISLDSLVSTIRDAVQKHTLKDFIISCYGFLINFKASNNSKENTSSEVCLYVLLETLHLNKETNKDLVIYIAMEAGLYFKKAQDNAGSESREASKDLSIALKLTLLLQALQVKHVYKIDININAMIRMLGKLPGKLDLKEIALCRRLIINITTPS